MAVYRCHFLDVRDRIEAHEEIEADTLIDAIHRAKAMLAERAHHSVVEVWAGNRWLYRVGHGAASEQKLRH